MANLAKNKWYCWYLRMVPTGQLTLPPYETDNAGNLIIYYGELFCRKEDCAKGQKKYTATNNLRTHLKAHENTSLAENNKGGRVGQKEMDRAIKWYKDLFSGEEPQLEEGTGGGSGGSRFGSGNASIPLPALPLTKKDGKVHVTDMRKLVRNMGKKVPCGSCGDRRNCCKDINLCEHFLLFNCDKLAPATHNDEQENAGANAEENDA